MHGKKSFLALSTAFAALFVGCEWTGTSESDSWSSAYDAMNFSGTYRAVTSVTSTEESESNIAAASVSGGKFAQGKNIASGTTQRNIVPGSFQATAGNYVWNDNGSGVLVFTDPTSGAAGSKDISSAQEVIINSEPGKTTTSAQTYTWDVKNHPIKPGSVTVSLNGSPSFKDNKDAPGILMATGISGGGTVNYETGSITVTFSDTPSQGALTVSYTYYNTATSIDGKTLSGSGTILYQSGSWTLQINPAMPKDETIQIRYSYYKDGTSTDVSYTTIYSSDEVSALTVAQNGQNLSITLNNGIVMSGKFTNVQQTGKVNQDTNAGYNTYNAQFQVQTKDSKMVGSLNYDLKTGYRMLNGSWTWGKNTYDVQAVGPAWLNSADASTLSAGVQQSQK